MKNFTCIAIVGLFASVPFAAQAEGSDGSRMPAGGNLMSSYVSDPHHDPRSQWSQANRTGQILGQPMVHENAGAHGVTRNRVVAPHWAAGAAPRRHGR